MLTTIKTETGTYTVQDTASVMAALAKIKPPKPTLSRKGLSVRCPVWRAGRMTGMTTYEYIRQFEAFNNLKSGGYVFKDGPAATYNPDLPIFEVLPDDPDYIEPVKVAKVTAKRATRAKQAEIALQRILEINPVATADTTMNDLWYAIGEIRNTARHGLGID